MFEKKVSRGSEAEKALYIYGKGVGGRRLERYPVPIKKVARFWSTTRFFLGTVIRLRHRGGGGSHRGGESDVRICCMRWRTYAEHTRVQCLEKHEYNVPNAKHFSSQKMQRSVQVLVWFGFQCALSMGKFRSLQKAECLIVRIRNRCERKIRHLPPAPDANNKLLSILDPPSIYAAEPGSKGTKVGA